MGFACVDERDIKDILESDDVRDPTKVFWALEGWYV
jgi:hypothetical protein